MQKAPNSLILLRKVLHGIGAFLSPREFWMVYVFYVYAFLYGVMNRGILDERITYDYKFRTPIWDYPITIASGTCAFLWFCMIIRLALRWLQKKDLVLPVLYGLHLYLMIYLADFFSGLGTGVAYGLLR